MNFNKLLYRSIEDNTNVYSLPEDFHFHLLSFSAFASVYCMCVHMHICRCVCVCIYIYIYIYIHGYIKWKCWKKTQETNNHEQEWSLRGTTNNAFFIKHFLVSVFPKFHYAWQPLIIAISEYLSPYKRHLQNKVRPWVTIQDLCKSSDYPMQALSWSLPGRRWTQPREFGICVAVCPLDTNSGTETGVFYTTI